MHVIETIWRFCVSNIQNNLQRSHYLKGISLNSNGNEIQSGFIWFAFVNYECHKLFIVAYSRKHDTVSVLRKPSELIKMWKASINLTPVVKLSMDFIDTCNAALFHSGSSPSSVKCLFFFLRIDLQFNFG